MVSPNSCAYSKNAGLVIISSHTLLYLSVQSASRLHCLFLRPLAPAVVQIPGPHNKFHQIPDRNTDRFQLCFLLFTVSLVFPCAHLILRSSHWRALLPAFTGGILVNNPRKTNVCCAAACFSFGLIISYTQVPRAFALYCLLSQTEPSLMVQEKQMPPSVSLVFLLDSL